MINKVSKEGSIGNKILSTVFSKKVQMSFEFDHFKKFRSWKNGITFFTSTLECNYKGDHTPFLNLYIGMFNYTIIELCVYNVNHDPEDEDEAPYKVEPQV